LVTLEIPVEDLAEGDTVALHTGEKISVDGIYSSGKYQTPY